MIVAITGVCGFIGSAIANAVRERGYRVIGIDRLNECKYPALDEYYKCDLAKETEVSNLIKLAPKCDVVVHAAAIISFGDLESEMMQVNCIGTLQVGRFALTTGVGQLVYISSVPVIGKPETVPITECNNEPNPQTLYHLTKYIGEMIFQLPQFENLNVTILRLPAPVSPVMPNNRLLPMFLKKAMRGEPIVVHGKGNRVQNYVDTRDIGKAVALAVDKRTPGLFLIGGESLSNNEVASLCNDLCESKAGIEYSSIPDLEERYRWVISCDKSQKELGYKSEHSVKEVLRQMKETIERGAL